MTPKFRVGSFLRNLLITMLPFPHLISSPIFSYLLSSILSYLLSSILSYLLFVSILSTPLLSSSFSQLLSNFHFFALTLFTSYFLIYLLCSSLFSSLPSILFNLILPPLYDSFLDSASRNQSVDVYGLCLSNSMHPGHSLNVDLRIPIAVETERYRSKGKG